MSRLLESIRFENGKFSNLLYHQQRMNRSRKELFGCKDEIDLVKILQASLEAENASPPLQAYPLEKSLGSAGFVIRPQRATDLQSEPSELEKTQGLYKCRIIYSEKIEHLEFVPYNLPSINSLKIIFDDQIIYSHKFNNRTRINELFEKRENYDDILIVKKGFVTDTSFANILFYNGKKWLTPDHPLLKGTQRSYLLDEELIEAAGIRLEDLKYFKKVRLVNAMMQFEDKVDIEMETIWQ